MNQLLCTLRFYATGCHQITVADFSGISKSTAHRIIHRVSAAIASLRPLYVKFPETPEEIRRTQMDFFNIASFLRVLGAIDCTHIKVNTPGESLPEYFLNFFNLHCFQVVTMQSCFVVEKATFPSIFKPYAIQTLNSQT